MRPTLRQMQYLVAVAETGRFGDAAKSLHVSQPSLSAQIADMEAQLDTLLFERTRTGALLTQSGQIAVRRARLILRDVEDMKASLRQSQDGLSGQIRLGVLPSIGPYLLPRVTQTLHRQFPSLLMKVEEARNAALLAELSDGRLDVMISAGTALPDMDHTPLFTEHFYVCLAPDDPLAATDGPIKLADLKTRDLLSLGHGHQLNDLISTFASLAGANVSAEYVGTSLDAIRQMAAMGAGVAILPSLYCYSETRRDQALSVRKIEHPLAKRDISLFWRSTSPAGERYTLLGETLKGVAAELMEAG